ncbi:ATP-binding protein [Frankia sp. Mgl5]|uniref:ATP-binding protein n=1 Tax=Frankia sp. Mgl5 TaxID=2933793 RepID=UPI00200E5614|nr:ATP-binding protein [Frankia sp. Mgl5]MCK9929304.1 ATP-binding protein [Frankia sp. Mgl5]
MTLRLPTTRDDWQFSPPLAAANITAGLFLAGALGHYADLSPLWALPAAGLTAAGALLALRGRELSRTSLTIRILLWLAGGVWLWLALAGTPWRLDVAVSLLIVGVAAAVGAPSLSRRDQAHAAAAAITVEEKVRAGRLAEWKARIGRVSRIDVGIVTDEDWPTVDIDGRPVVPGFDLDVQLPEGGTTWEDLAGHAARLASDARLPHGCGVEVTPGIDRSRAIMGVSLVDTLAIKRPYPENHPLRTVNEPLPVGWHRSSTDVEINTRESSVLVVGPKGSGKTTFLHTLIAGWTEQVDHLIWVIDLNGGGLARPWLDAWLAGEVDRRAIDWAAATVPEALVMAEVLLAIVRERKALYADLRMEANSSLLPISATLPKITIVVDEGKAITGDGAARDRAVLAKTLLDVQEEGRNEGGDVARSNLRPTGDALGGIDARVQSDILVMMRPKEEEIDKLFSHARGARADDAPWQGTGLIAIGEHPPRPFRAPDLTPQAIRRVSIAVADRRPALDAPSAAIGGEAYARRWDPDRIGWLLNPGKPAGPGPATSPTGPSARDDTEEPVDLGSALAQMQNTAARLRADSDAAEGQTAAEPAGPADDDVLAGILAATEERESAAVRLARAGDRRGAALELLLDHDQTGAGASTLHPRLVATIAAAGDTTPPTSRSTLAEWLVGWWHARTVWRRQGRDGIYVHGELPRPADAVDPNGGDGE